MSEKIRVLLSEEEVDARISRLQPRSARIMQEGRSI